jgi:hypothetical protein
MPTISHVLGQYSAALILLGTSLLTALGILAAAAAHPSLLFPYKKDTSVLDFIVVSALLCSVSLAVAVGSSAANESRSRADTVASGAACVLVVFALFKTCFLLDWASMGTAQTAVAALILTVAPCGASTAAWLVHRSLAANRKQEDDEVQRYKRMVLSEGEEGGGSKEGDDDEPPELPVWRVIMTLKPYFWPRQKMGRVNVVLTWVFVCGSKATSIVAPLFIAKSTNALANGNIQEAMIAAML